MREKVLTFPTLNIQWAFTLSWQNIYYTFTKHSFFAHHV